MNIAASNSREHTAKICEKVANAVVSFFLDCRRHESSLNAAMWDLAFEYAYQPLPRFWRNLDLVAVVDALTQQYPSWRSAVETRGYTAGEVLREVESTLELHTFDEANAEFLMTLQEAARPTTADAAFQKILSEFRRQGRAHEMLFVSVAATSCGEGALLAMHCLTRAESGSEFLRPKREVARYYRGLRSKQISEGGSSPKQSC